MAGTSIRPVQSLQLQQLAIKMPHETNCFLSLAVNKMTENAISRVFIKVLHFQCTQFCSIMYKDHLDVYRLFIKSA